jgi:hypothetical protein
MRIVRFSRFSTPQAHEHGTVRRRFIMPSALLNESDPAGLAGLGALRALNNNKNPAWSVIGSRDEKRLPMLDEPQASWATFSLTGGPFSCLLTVAPRRLHATRLEKRSSSLRIDIAAWRQPAPGTPVAVSCKAPFRRRSFAFLSTGARVPAQSPLTAEIGCDLPHERSSLGRIQLWHFPAWRCETS